MPRALDVAGHCEPQPARAFSLPTDALATPSTRLEIALVGRPARYPGVDGCARGRGRRCSLTWHMPASRVGCSPSPPGRGAPPPHTMTHARIHAMIASMSSYLYHMWLRVK